MTKSTITSISGAKGRFMITEQHKAKAKELVELIRSQPPEVLSWLSDFCGMEDGEPMSCNDPDDAIEQMFSSHGYPDTLRPLLNQEIFLGMELPKILVDITFHEDEYGHDAYSWEFSKP